MSEAFDLPDHFFFGDHAVVVFVKTRNRFEAFFNFKDEDYRQNKSMPSLSDTAAEVFFLSGLTLSSFKLACS